MIAVLDDADVGRLADAPSVTRLMRACLVDAYEGRMTSPPRVVVPAGDTDLVVGAGGLPGGPVGLRVYGRWGPGSDQLTVVWGPGGRLLGVVQGGLLGVLRTGGLGAVALDALAPNRPLRIGVVGSGAQAWGQMWAATGVRSVEDIAVVSRDPDRAARFAARVQGELGLTCRPVGHAEEACAGRDVVVVATTSSTPVLRAEWLEPTAVVMTLGTGGQGRGEIPPELIRDAGHLVSDAPDQVRATGPDLAGRTVVHLGAHAARPTPAPPTDGRSVYLSFGLTGSEARLAAWLMTRPA